MRIRTANLIASIFTGVLIIDVIFALIMAPILIIPVLILIYMFQRKISQQEMQEQIPHFAVEEFKEQLETVAIEEIEKLLKPIVRKA